VLWTPPVKGVSNSALDTLNRCFAEHCFCCLASDNYVTKCRDPVSCILYQGTSHFAHSYPSCQPHHLCLLLCPPHVPLESIHSHTVLPLLLDPTHSIITAKPDTVHVPTLAQQRPVRHRISIILRECNASRGNHTHLITGGLRSNALWWLMLWQTAAHGLAKHLCHQVWP
jgi:hypothetical protein